MKLIEIIGYIPAVIFPLATIAQLSHLYRTKSAQGVSISAWLAFALGNVSLYIYTEKYHQLQSIIGLLLTAVLQLVIVFLIVFYRKSEEKLANVTYPPSS